MPYSGPASAYGTIGKAIAAYFKMVNDAGRHQRPQDQLHLLDDGYSPPKTVEMARKLVEQDEVLFVFQTLGTPSNTAIHKYMNMKKVPQTVRRHRRHQVERPEGLSLDHGLAAELPDRGQDLRAAHPQDQAGREDRACSTRTTTTARTT